jgi:hypothetical protein
MALPERLCYLATICILIFALVVTTLFERRGASAAVMTHLEIRDTSGHTRMVLGTDANGTAELRFVDATGKKVSGVKQYSDGSTSMQFAGTGDTPGIRISAMQRGPSPIIALAGNSDDQRLYLGAADHQDDVPSLSPKAYAWGLYVPAGGFRPPYAAVGAYRDQKSGEIRGFVFPER